MDPNDIVRPEGLETHEQYASYAPTGTVTLEEGAVMVIKALNYARKQGIAQLLIDGCRLHGMEVPTLSQRYWLAHRFAAASAKKVALALALQAYLLDQGRYGVGIAWQLGMRVDAFTGPVEALDWLLSGADPRPVP